MKKLMPSEGLRLGCSSGSTRCVIAKNYVLGQPGGGYEKPRGASQLLGEDYVRYSSILASVDGDAYLLFLGAVGEGGHQLPHGLAAVGQAARVEAAAYQDAAGGVGGAVTRVDADALEVGDVLQ